MPRHQFDLVVIGTGPASGSTADRCREAGWSVAIIDSRPFGGTCAVRGCVPKKILSSAAEVYHQTQKMTDHGLRAENVRLDWNELVRYKRTFTEPVPEKRERDYKKKGINAFLGDARFLSPNEIAVNDHVIKFGKALISTGSKPRNLEIEGEEHLIKSFEFMDLDELPKGMLFVGGGYIAMEFAHIAARTGACKVCVYEMGPRVLNQFEPEVIDHVIDYSREHGIEIYTNKRITKIEKVDGLFHVNSEEHHFKAAMVVHSAGRVPNIDELNLEAAHVEYTEKGVEVNEFLQTSNPNVYAAGDCANTGAPQLTPVAGLEGKAVGLNMLEGNKHRTDLNGLASVVFTVPPIAMVGLTEGQAVESGYDFEVKKGDAGRWFSNRYRKMPAYFKVLVEKETDRILGAHLFGHRADETINIFALAVRYGLTAKQLNEIPLAYPTNGHNVRYMV